MENQILEELQRTNELLNWVVYLLLAFVILWTVRGTFLVVRNWKKAKEKAVNEIARDLYKKEDYYELIEVCTKELESNPRELYSLYWKSKAQHKIGRTEGLKEAITSLLDVAPRWKEEWMDNYLKPEASEEESQKANKARDQIAGTGGATD